jgi:hypothetical protein
MLNEGAYIKSHRLALQWALGCALTAVKERVTYELEKASMSRKLLKTLLGLGGVLAIGALGIYIDAKPYQRERIRIALGHGTHSDQREGPGRANGAPALEPPNNRVQPAGEP